MCLEGSEWKTEVPQVSFGGTCRSREYSHVVQERIDFNIIFSMLSLEKIKGIKNGLFYVVSFSHKNIYFAGHVPVPTFSTEVPGDFRRT